MAENRFNITVTATDNATKVVNKINKSVNKVFRPYDDARKSVKSFSDAIGRNDFVRRPLWALDKVGRGVTMFGNTFGVAESSVIGGSARMASALGLIGGPIGGFLAGATALVGGAIGIGVAMASSGRDISRTAKNLNITTGQLQEYRGAAKLAGLETGTMDRSLQTLGERLQAASTGFDPDASMAMHDMNLEIGRTKDGAVDVIKALRGIADVVSHQPDQNKARLITDALGVTELLPLLREGTLKLDEYTEKTRKLGIQSDAQVKNNEQQAQAWNQTTTAIDSAATSVGNLSAKYLGLNKTASLATSVAQKLSGSFDSGGSHWWDKLTIPSVINPKGIFSLIDTATAGMDLWGSIRGGPVSEGGRTAVGKVAGLIGNSASPLGIRNNNPGNLRSWPGAGSAGGFAVFSSPQAGIGAMARNLGTYQDQYGINTLAGIANRWAPASDGNRPGAYIDSLSRQTGFGADQPLDLHNPQVLTPLISAITKQENGQNPYSPEVIAQAVASALKDAPIKLEVSGMPHGMSIKPVRGLGMPNVGAAMAPGGAS